MQNRRRQSSASAGLGLTASDVFFKHLCLGFVLQHTGMTMYALLLCDDMRQTCDDKQVCSMPQFDDCLSTMLSVGGRYHHTLDSCHCGTAEFCQPDFYSPQVPMTALLVPPAVCCLLIPAWLSAARMLESADSSRY